MQTWLKLGLAATIACTACNDKGEKQEAPPVPSAAPTPAAAPVAPAAPAAPTPPPVAKVKVELQIASVANLMAYDKKTLTVPTGAEVHLTIKNNATMDTLPHNWVLVKPGTEAKVAAAGLEKAPDAGYVVEGENVLAHTPLAMPGKEADVTFTAPAPGAYPYICTFPGHYIMMKGVLTVTP